MPHSIQRCDTPAGARARRRISGPARGERKRALWPMSAATKIKCRCPSCQTKYRLGLETVGRKARCSRCQTVFRVKTSHHIKKKKKQGPPTESDILRWLMEEADEADLDVRPRMEPQTAPASSAAAPPGNAASPAEGIPVKPSGDTSGASEVLGVSPEPAEPTPSSSEPAASSTTATAHDPLRLRQTG